MTFLVRQPISIIYDMYHLLSADFLDWYHILQSEDFKQKEQVGWQSKQPHTQQSQAECLFEKRLFHMKPGLFDFRRNS